MSKKTFLPLAGLLRLYKEKRGIFNAHRGKKSALVILN